MIPREFRLACLVAGALVLVFAHSSRAQTSSTVDDPSGQVIRTQRPHAQATDRRPGQGPMKPGVVSDPMAPTAPGSNGSPRPPCSTVAPPGFVTRESRQPTMIVDACGERHLLPGGNVLPEAVGAGPSNTAGVVIDSMTTDWFTYVYGSPQPSIGLLGTAAIYYLSDGSSWRSGAGTARVGKAALDRIEVVGKVIRYYFRRPTDSVLYQQTDFNNGYHSSQGTLGCTDPLLLEAVVGSPTAVMKGQATITSNDATSYGEPLFNYFAASVGSIVPFEAVYGLSTPGGWTEDVFNGPMAYGVSGRVSFVRGVSLPPLAEVTISGPPQVGGTSTFQYHAVARYENSALREVTATATWSVSPPSLATIDQGLLTTLPMQSSQANLIVRADYTEGGITRTGEKAVLYRAALPEPATESWPMYQADARHTGHVALSLDPAHFALRWQKAVGDGAPLNPVTAAEDKVFCSLVTYFYAGLTVFTLNADDGSERWSKSFAGDFGGGPFSVNPPSFGYGNVTFRRAITAPTRGSAPSTPPPATSSSSPRTVPSGNATSLPRSSTARSTSTAATTAARTASTRSPDRSSGSAPCLNTTSGRRPSTATSCTATWASTTPGSTSSIARPVRSRR